MFTGLVQEVGRVAALARRGTGADIEVSASTDDLEVGESVAVSGACLTIESLGAGRFSAFVSSETLSRTGLGSARPGDEVNLERAVAAGAPMGGHIVTGHVDARVALLARLADGESERWTVAMPEDPDLRRQLTPKGSVALDGVSLTVNDVLGDRFETAIVPHTLRSTTLGRTRPGARINLETDILAKYVARHLDGGDGEVSMELLLRSGFARAEWTREHRRSSGWSAPSRRSGRAVW